METLDSYEFAMRRHFPRFCSKDFPVLCSYDCEVFGLEWVARRQTSRSESEQIVVWHALLHTRLTHSISSLIHLLRMHTHSLIYM